MRLGIVGLGLMGASFAEALHRTRPEIELVGVDADPTTLATALERGIIREPGVEGADLIMLAVPPLAIRDLLPNLPRHALVTDMASTKARIMVWAAESGVDFVGGHPMCGREASGIGAADPEMFAGAPWVLTRIDSRVEDLVRAVGSYPIVMDPERHDRLVAALRHSAFVLPAAYARAVAGARDWTGSGGSAPSGYRDPTRPRARRADAEGGGGARASQGARPVRAAQSPRR